MNTSADWYKQHLGFSEVHLYDKNGKTFCMIEKNGLQLELISSEDTQDFANKQSALPRWMRHFCIEVEDLQEIYTAMTAGGVRIEKEITEAGFSGHYFFISDPDGNMMEI